MEAVWKLLAQLVVLHTITVTGSFVNIAKDKPVAASSIYDGFSANTGVDGNTVAKDWNSNQIVAAIGPSFAWWKVDLEREVQGATVRIYFRTGYTYRRNGVKLYTNINPFSSYPEGQLCKEFISNLNGTDIADVYNVTCQGRWRHLLFYTNTNNDGKGPILDFGEVEVYDNLYGTDCSFNCTHRKCIDGSSPCNHVTGLCVDGCQTGYAGIDCRQECDLNTYGFDCKLCSSRSCLTDSSCNRTTGECEGGCQPGYWMVDCSEPCQSDLYGSGCNSSCSGRNCLNTSSSCDHVTGQCVGGCQAGYKNTTDCIERCESDFYGRHCSLSCTDRKCNDGSSPCDHVTGQCVDGCKAGYNGTDCTKVCDFGFYGSGCSHSCSVRNCLHNSSECDHVTGQCDDGCQAGYHGADCKEACSHGMTYGVDCEMSCNSRHCMNSSSDCDLRTGQCPGGCKTGWRGLDCTSLCESDFYGRHCSLSCTDRKCNDGSSPCDHVTGQCVDGCKAGYNGTDCTKVCDFGFYGSGCSHSCSVRNCLHNSSECDHVTGQCDDGCQAGYHGADCKEECSKGFYGPECNMTCGNCSSDGVCHHVTGSCQGGCKTGWTSVNCDEVAEKTPEAAGLVVPAVAGAAALLLICVVVAVVVLYRRRRKRNEHSEHEGFSEPCPLPADDNNVYVNVSMESISLNQKEIVKEAIVPDKPSDHDDQSVEIIDEDETPTSSPYYNIDEEDNIREVAVEDLAATVQKIKRRKGGFETEYNRLPTGFTATYADSQMEENKVKNKFIGYYPYDHNRVRLSLIPDVPGSDYINASIMHNINHSKTYIAAQGLYLPCPEPSLTHIKPSPKKITLGDFWRMIWEQRCGRVVMLTGLVEDSKVKCYQYWPEDDLLATDHFRVTLEDTDTRANYTIRTMKVEKLETGESRRVVQYHFTTWPDHGVPDTLALVNFIWMMRRTHTRTDGPLLVHCSAGIGRTGTYIAVDSLLDQAREEGKVDVQGYVSMMRGQRKNMIQTKDQYECVFNCLVEMTKYGNTSLTVDDFTTLYTNSGMDARVDSDGKTFRELAQLILAEKTSEAPIKNRLWVDGNQDFIVRTAPSLRRVRGHLLCESPHPGQEKLLWKLVEENNVNNVIVLDKTEDDFVGGKGSTITFDEIELTTEEQTKLTSDLRLAKLLLQIPIHHSKQKLQLLQFLEHVSMESLSDSFLEHSHLKLMMSELSSRAVLHSSTDRRIGVMFCLLGNLMSEIQEDETVDVLHQVRSFTRIFPDITLTQNDVKLLFDFARRSAHSTGSTYANM